MEPQSRLGEDAVRQEPLDADERALAAASHAMKLSAEQVAALPPDAEVQLTFVRAVLLEPAVQLQPEQMELPVLLQHVRAAATSLLRLLQL